MQKWLKFFMRDLTGCFFKTELTIMGYNGWKVKENDRHQQCRVGHMSPSYRTNGIDYGLSICRLGRELVAG